MLQGNRPCPYAYHDHESRLCNAAKGFGRSRIVIVGSPNGHGPASLPLGVQPADGYLVKCHDI